MFLDRIYFGEDGTENGLTPGQHTLSGISATNISIDGGYMSEYNGYAFIIDNNLYFIGEDYDDGYRSMGLIVKVNDNSEFARYLAKEAKDNNIRMTMFPNEQVNIEIISGKVKDDETGFDSDVCKYVFKNAKTGNIVLEVGTDETEDYYPYAIFKWHPENLSCNEKINEKKVLHQIFSTSENDGGWQIYEENKIYPLFVGNYDTIYMDNSGIYRTRNYWAEGKWTDSVNDEVKILMFKKI